MLSLEDTMMKSSYNPDCRNTGRQLITSRIAQGLQKVLRYTREEVAVLQEGGEVKCLWKTSFKLKDTHEFAFFAMM